MGRTLGCESRKGRRHSRHVLSKACKRTAGGLIEALERRVLLADGGASDALPMDASVSGQVFLDYNQNGILDADEPGLAGWTVLVDVNGNGAVDAGEASSVTNDQGAYRMSALAPGSATIALLPQDRWTAAVAKTVMLESGQEQKGINFGTYAPITADLYAATGPEVRVDTPSAASASWPSIARDSAGNYVIVWKKMPGDNSWFGIYAQRFDATGAPRGSEFCVSMANNFPPQSYDFHKQVDPVVAMDTDGDFVVVWESDPKESDSIEIHARRYNAAGDPQGDEFAVNTQGRSPAVAMDSAGNFVVAWSSPEGRFGLPVVWARRYDASGTPLGSEFAVAPTRVGSQKTPSLGMSANGDVVIAWQDLGERDTGIFAQRYDETGQAQGGPICVTTYEAPPVVAMGQDGSFAVAWIFGSVGVQRFNAAGVAQGGRTTVVQSSWVIGPPSIAADNVGGYMVAWTDSSPGGSSYISVARIDALGIKRAAPGMVNTAASGTRQHPSLITIPSGGYIVTWDNKSPAGVYARRCEVVPPSPDPSLGLTDGRITRRGEEVWVYPNYTGTGLPIAIYPAAPLATLSVRMPSNMVGRLVVDLSQDNPIPSGGLFLEGDYACAWDLDSASTVADFALSVRGKLTVYLPPGKTLGALNLLDTSRVIVGGKQNVMAVGALSIAPGAAFDLEYHSLIVHATPETREAVLAEVSGWIKSGRADGSWTGKGLYSYKAQTNKQTGLSVMLNERNGKPIYTTFAGQGVGVNDVLIKYTWNGDVNLDGVVDAADYFLVDSGFITQQGGYRNGDLNLDGVVDASDYFLIDSAFIAQTGTVAAEVAPVPVDDPVDDVLIVHAARAQEGSAVPVSQQLFAVNPLLSTETQDVLD